MRNYKNYLKQHIGSSDIASLKLRGGDGEESELHFGGDDDYLAYVVDEDAVIGSHYKLVAEYSNEIKIYDDRGLSWAAKAELIRVYQAGEYGCVIQLINPDASGEHVPMPLD